MPQLADGLTCPACQSDVKLSFTIADKERTDWVFCKCGSVFHQKRVEKAYFNDEYHQKYSDYKALPERYDYILRLYLPIIKELTYGVRSLDVGYGCDFNIKSLTEDGWIAEGIDLIDSRDGQIVGDFEKHDFKNKKYNFIFMGSVLESFHDPIKALFKAKELMFKGGALLIVTPDAELIYEKGMFEFGNWNPNDKSIIFSEKQLRKILETLGFKIIMARKDTQKRCIGWNHVHFLVQKVD